MKYVISLIFVWVILCFNAYAQKATIREQKVRMKTYMYSDPNPVPDMEKNYPYFRIDGFTNKSIEKDWNMVIMENEYVKVYIATEIGGKIWGAIEKSTGGEFLYFNDVVKFRDVALRGPWTSGGLEYNFGIMSHVSTCATPQDYVLLENPDGSVSCNIGAMDLHTQTRWNVEVILPKDGAYVKTITSWFNCHNIPVSFYHYMNAAAKTQGNLEFIYPGNHYIGHGGDVGDWPIEKGRNISFYDNNNFGSYKSYHVLNAYSDYMGGYWHDDDFGFGHLVDYADLPGKKLWLWGLSEQGMIWVDLLTDTKGQYIEFQSGKTFNQAMSRSSLTPFKHTEFIPYDTDITTEYYFPLKGTGGMVEASEYAVLNVKRNTDNIEIILSALQKLDTKLVVKSGTNTLKQDEVILDPLELFTSKVEIDPTQDFTVELGDQLLYYSSKKEDLIVDRPLYPNDEFDWNSAVGLYTQALEIEKQQSYMSGGPANRSAHELYLKSLEVDPAFAPSLNRMALSFYKRVEYEKALEYDLKSLAIDTYDPLANYLYGLINIKLNKIANAKSGFSIATQSPLYRSAAWTELARLYLVEQRFKKAEWYVEKAIAYNQYNMIALEIQALIQRQLGNQEMFTETLNKLHEYDKTSTFYKYMEIHERKGDLKELSQLITNELPDQSYLELAVKFYNYGFPEESIDILKVAPEQAIIYLWLAYLDKNNEEEWLKSGLNSSPDFVFPYRDETLEVLEYLMKINNDWKLKYYASLVYWKKDCIEEAKNLFDQCGDLPDYTPFYLAKAKLFKDDPSIKKASLNKAKAIDPEDWRVNSALITQYIEEGEYANAAGLAFENIKKYPERPVLGLNYSIALLNMNEYKKCVSFLESYVVIPFEGATMGRRVYHEAAFRAALEEMKKKKYKNAISYAKKALLWPLNLGSGKPYDTDERLENYSLAYCYKKIGKSDEAGLYYSKVINHKNADNSRENALLYLQVLSLQENDKSVEARMLINEALENDPHNKYIRWVKEVDIHGISGPNTEDMIQSERNTSPIDNEFLLLNELISVIK